MLYICMEKNLIGFAGRKRSGKGVLSNYLVSLGYEKLSFATPLKTLCCEILDLPGIDELNKEKDNGTHIDFSIEKALDILERYFKLTREMEKGLEGINTVRALLQYVGTDIIRTIYPQWHVEMLKKMINPEKKIVIDDVRFPNEKEMIKEMGGEVYFVMRPGMREISNHPSETSLGWTDFGILELLVNDGTEEDLIQHYINGDNRIGDWVREIYNSKNPLIIESLKKAKPY